MKRSAHLRALSIALAAVALFSGARPSQAAEASSDTTGKETVERIAAWLRPVFRPGDGKYVVLPKVTHSSEAGWGVGAEVGRSFQWGGIAADSDVRFTGKATFDGDGQAGATLNLGWLDRKYTFRTVLWFDNIPRSFYGIGPDTPESNRETYQRQSVRYYIEVHRRLTGHFRVGVRGEAEDNVMLEMAPGGLLQSGTYGATKSAVAGAGLLATWDSRERRYSPRRGMLHQFFWMRFGSVGGNDFEFNVFNADLRWYLPVRSSDVLVLQLFGYATDERPPFWRLAAIGGRGHSRGYRLGRYLDEVMAAAQAEYRLSLFWRVGLVGYAGVAQVAPLVRDLDVANIHPTVGTGLRFRLGRNGAHARLDAAYGDSFHLYFSLDEAF